MALARQFLDHQWVEANLAAADLDRGGDVGGGGGAAEQVEHVAGEVTLEGAQGLAACLAFLLFACEERLGARVDAALDDGDLVQRGVQAAVAVSVEPVPPLLAGGGVERGDAGKPGELGVALEALDARDLADDPAGARRSRAGPAVAARMRLPARRCRPGSPPRCASACAGRLRS
jgi:hypothetical protein